MNGRSNQSTNSCTHSTIKGRCKQTAVVELRWYETVQPGWAITNYRAYCKPHSDEAITRLHERSVAVNVTTITLPIPITR